ncbi:hypothetical protein DM793_04035 [Paenarthrobacter nitroguajacolicus]|uniref:hypothetical protein n=1 Tax=Paenarthrobacter nitroguajacolicus TaxID=211146 RepID=UPI0015B90576|nr:hypothetical protein [Paenarthrobacter nitroguajacolicus]NWL10270.1 hypothetical protein [Paenarthrobacter nitroguajacolicus]NWL10472.1 hypothetical protein [Paenarthrobacter nitroguajacolicus]
MSILETLNGLLGKRPSDEPAAPGYEHFGGEPADPRNSRYWRSIPHMARIAIPTMADYMIEIVSRVRAHAAGIDDATGPFMHPLIDAEAEAVGVAIEERHQDQVRTEQGLWADEDTIAYRHQQNAQILKTQLEIADADYRAGKDALLGEPGATPAWDAAVTSTRHTPALPMPVPGLPAPRAVEDTPARATDEAPEPVQARPAPAGPARKNRRSETASEEAGTEESGRVYEIQGAEAPEELDEEAA